LEQIAHIGVNVSRFLKLFGGEIIFEVQYSNLCDHGTWTLRTDNLLWQKPLQGVKGWPVLRVAVN